MPQLQLGSFIHYILVKTLKRSYTHEMFTYFKLLMNGKKDMEKLI